MELLRRGAFGRYVRRIGPSSSADPFASGSVELEANIAHGDDSGVTPNGALVSILDVARKIWIQNRITTLSGRIVTARLEIDYRTPLRADERFVVVLFILLRANRTGVVLREVVQSSNTQRVIAESVSTVEFWDVTISDRVRMSDEQLDQLRGDSDEERSPFTTMPIL